MSSLAEIEAAIEALPASERATLEERLLARRFSLDVLDADERQALLSSIEQAEVEIDAGDVRTAEELRAAVRTWAGR
jgi:hypothetical protein